MPKRLELSLNLDTLSRDYDACVSAIGTRDDLEIVLGTQPGCDLAGIQLLASVQKSLLLQGRSLNISGEGAPACKKLWEQFGMPGGLGPS